MNNNPIYVTRPDLPHLEEFAEYLRQIWSSKILTNSGPFHIQLEEDLCKHIKPDKVMIFRL